jgi:hypothetical protein
MSESVGSMHMYKGVHGGKCIGVVERYRYVVRHFSSHGEAYSDTRC